MLSGRENVSSTPLDAVTRFRKLSWQNTVNKQKEKYLCHMHSETNKISNWLSKWSKLEDCILNSLGEREEKWFLGKNQSLYKRWVGFKTARRHMTMFVYWRAYSSPSSGPSHSQRQANSPEVTAFSQIRDAPRRLFSCLCWISNVFSLKQSFCQCWALSGCSSSTSMCLLMRTRS